MRAAAASVGTWRQEPMLCGRAARTRASRPAGPRSSEFYAKANHDGRLRFAARGPHGGADKAVSETVGDLRPVHPAIDIVVLVDDIIDHARGLIEVACAQ